MEFKNETATLDFGGAALRFIRNAEESMTLIEGGYKIRVGGKPSAKLIEKVHIFIEFFNISTGIYDIIFMI